MAESVRRIVRSSLSGCAPRRISSASALEIGLVHQVVPRAGLAAAVDGMLAELAGCAPLSVQSAKSAIERGYGKPLTEGLDIGLATVYRVLTQFEQAGLLIRHHFESGKAVFELNEGKHHDHLVCMQCGRVEEFYDAEIEKRQHKIARDRGFEISEHALYLYAECTKPRCPHRKDGDTSQ